MLFNSYIFVFLFLPIALMGWYLLNKAQKYKGAQLFLIALSLWFYAYFDIGYLWIIVASCLANYGFSLLLVNKSSQGFKRVMLVVGCVFNLGLLGYFKYTDFLLENINAVFSADFT